MFDMPAFIASIRLGDRPVHLHTSLYDFYESQDDASLRLLRSHLSLKQCNDFREKGRFSVFAHGPYGLREYWILHTHTHCVVDPFNGVRYCAICLGVPLFDQLLTIKLLLQNDPVTFFSVAMPSASF